MRAGKWIGDVSGIEPADRWPREDAPDGRLWWKPPFGSTIDPTPMRYASTEPSLQTARFKEGMMGRWAWSVAVAIAILLFGPACSAQGLISRKYVLDRNQSDDVSHAIESAVPSPSNVDWPDLRGRLLKSNVPTDGFRITSIAGRISVSDDSPRPIIDVFANGSSMKWKINNGQVIDVSAKAIGEAVSLTFRGIDHERTTVYHNNGQQLVVESIIISPGLAAPIHYKLVYS